MKFWKYRKFQKILEDSEIQTFLYQNDHIITADAQETQKYIQRIERLKKQSCFNE